MIRISNIKRHVKEIPWDRLENPEEERRVLKQLAAKKLGISPKELRSLRLYKRAVDARNKADVQLIYHVDVEMAKEAWLLQRRRDPSLRAVAKTGYPSPPAVPLLPQRPVVVGLGPAGLFAALILAQAGQCPIVLERGDPMEERQKTVGRFWTAGRLDPESNVQFGEGGAGTFSDGKLTTGTRDPRIMKVLESFVAAGAPDEILYNAMPHLGTDRLPGIVIKLRSTIEALGGTVFFRSRLTGFRHQNGGLTGVEVGTGIGRKHIPCDRVILAAGHSARDIFHICHEMKLPMEAKAFSVGARIEHHRTMIDDAQYGPFAGHPALGAAAYKLSCHLPSGRGVYTFCMCPGGMVTGAASETGQVVVNGMSNWRRDGENSNAALLVSVTPKDFGDQVLDGVAFQRRIEEAAFRSAGESYALPGQLLSDFLADLPSRKFLSVKPTALPGVIPGKLSDCLPEGITQSMGAAIGAFQRKLKGFGFQEAVLTAPETRSSSPVRLIRGADGMSPGLSGLFPCGEGAGYAGGIVSAAVDGIKSAEALLRWQGH